MRVDRMHVAQDRDEWLALEPSGSIKGEECLD
jgi:hypothetical protein